MSQPFFQQHFGLTNPDGSKNVKRTNNVSSIVVSVLQGGAFFGALGSAPISGASCPFFLRLLLLTRLLQENSDVSGHLSPSLPSSPSALSSPLLPTSLTMVSRSSMLAVSSLVSGLVVSLQWHPPLCLSVRQRRSEVGLRDSSRSWFVTSLSYFSVVLIFASGCYRCHDFILHQLWCQPPRLWCQPLENSLWFPTRARWHHVIRSSHRQSMCLLV